jgi:hypothetical protein
MLCRWRRWCGRRCFLLVLARLGLLVLLGLGIGIGGFVHKVNFGTRISTSYKHSALYLPIALSREFIAHLSLPCRRVSKCSWSGDSYSRTLIAPLRSKYNRSHAFVCITGISFNFCVEWESWFTYLVVDDGETSCGGVNWWGWKF